METFALLSVNVGLPKVIGRDRGGDVISGIDKRPVATESVMVRTLGIEGDGQADLEVHGGPDKAVYVYPAANWSWWAAEHGLVCRPALFGENLTLGGGGEDAVHIGDRFAWGEALLEVCQPRGPCYKLAIHAGRAELPQIMTRTARCGWYLRVLREGAAPASGALRRVLKSDSPSVREAFAAVFSRHPDRSLLRRVYETPSLPLGWRELAARALRAQGA